MGLSGALTVMQLDSGTASKAAATAALLGAMKEATAWIKSDKKAAAETYLRVTKDRMPVEELLAMLNDPSIVITIPRARDGGRAAQAERDASGHRISSGVKVSARPWLRRISTM